jgi:membrane-bound serine protease (ClpP class)
MTRHSSMLQLYSMPFQTDLFRHCILIRFFLLIVLLILCSSSIYAAKIVELPLKGAIGPVTAYYVEKRITNTHNDDLVLVILDTQKDRDEASLLSQLNNVNLNQNNKKITKNTANPSIETVTSDWRIRYLSVITNPTVAYLLMLLGIYGICFELMSPGFFLPGVLGTVSLLITLYAFQFLPVNYAGLGLILLGIVFILVEGFAPTYGTLGLGGTIAFVLGSIMLMGTDNEGNYIAWPVILIMAVINIALFSTLIGMIFKSRKQQVKNGLIMLVGAKGRALGSIDLKGQAIIRGEIWSVYSKLPIDADKNIRVVLTSGLLLEVEEDPEEQNQ